MGQAKVHTSGRIFMVQNNLNHLTLYTLKECRSILKIGRNKMLELIWNGEIEAFKIGGHWRVSEEALKEYVHHQS